VTLESEKQGFQGWKALLVCLVVTGVFVYQYFFGWLYLGGQHGFGDLIYVLDRVSCIEFGWEKLYSLRTEEVCTGYIYGSTLLKILSLIPVAIVETNIVAYSFIVIFTLIYVVTVSQSVMPLSLAFFSIVLFFSPPIVLLLERLNIDLIIFLLVYYAASFRGKSLWLLAPTCLALASLFKFYTLPLLIGQSLNFRKRKRAIVLISILLPTLTLVIIDMRRLEYLPWDARNMFGNAIWLEYVLYVVQGPYTHANFAAASLLGITLIACVGIVLYKMRFLEGPTAIVHGQSANRLVFVLSTYTFCYFSGLSVDYRLVFLLFSYLLAEQLFFMAKATAWILRISMFLSLYLSYNVEILQPLGDLAQVICLVIIWKLSWRTSLAVFRNIADEILKIVGIVFTGVSRNRH